jgi:dihydropteroate synthase
MGVVNVTPDSFSDGGEFINSDKAIEHGLRLISEGAAIIDVGGESTRPGAEVIDTAEEIARVVPVIEGLAGKAKFLSIDTRHAATMEAALKAGANAVNDISALSHDIRAADVVAEAKVPVFLMHMQGDPKTMQVNPRYNNVVEDVFQYLQERINYCETRRIDENQLVIDPGIGFGKTVEDNVLLLRNIKRFNALQLPVLVGVSRKSMIAKISDGEPVDERIPGSLSAALWAYSQGVNIFRVHDVKETIQALKVYSAISSAA